MARSSVAVRNDALLVAADLLDEEWDQLVEANRGDLERAEASGMAAAAQDRLRLSEDRVRSMAAGLRGVAGLADPVGEVVEGWVRPNGLRVTRVRVPLGVVGVIYENRPNVTSDAAGLCLKAGNAAFLRGSGSALASNRAVVAVLRRAAVKAGLPDHAVALVEDPSHETAVEFMRLRGLIDCLIPRGGPDLIASMLEHATVPYVLDGAGNCHVYVDAGADLAMALDVVANAKTHRFGVCNAAETILVHAAVAEAFLPGMAASLEAAGVEVRGDERVRALVPGAAVATETDFATEFLGPTVAVGVVADLGAAIDHIARFSSGHSEAIVTGDLRAADRFVAEVDAAAVLVNASTRFIDGTELGLGAEVGISTQKLHARGPMGVRELTSTKWVVRGDGQVRPMTPDHSSAGLGLPDAGPARFASLDEVRVGLAQVGYLADEAISGVVYLADRLSKPVLVEGPAGTGKTQLAKSVADLTGARLIRLQCYEGLDESKALYEWNYRKQLLRIQAGEHGEGEREGPSWKELEEDIFSEDFLLARPLLEAIRSTDPVVLLVDEVDRVELETEALLLEILSEYQVSIPELGTVKATRLPMVFLTSNNTRELSEALKRRCLYLHVDYPDLDRERDIVRSRVPGITEELADQVARIVRSLRTLELRKAPSVSETLDWARTLVILGVETIDAAGARDTLHVLLKYQSDIERAAKELLTAAG